MYCVPSVQEILLGIHSTINYRGTYFHFVSVLRGHPFKLTYFRLLACPVPGIVTQDDTLYLVTSRSKRFLNYLFCSTNTESKLNREEEERLKRRFFKKKHPGVHQYLQRLFIFPSRIREHEIRKIGEHFSLVTKRRIIVN